MSFDEAVQADLSSVLEQVLEKHPQLEGLTVTFSWGYGIDRQQVASGVTRFSAAQVSLPAVIRMTEALAKSQCDLVTAVLRGKPAEEQTAE